MKLLNEYNSVQEAYIDKGLLESNGIPAVVQEDSLSELFPPSGFGFGKISLYVPDNNYDKAKELIECP